MIHAVRPRCGRGADGRNSHGLKRTASSSVSGCTTAGTQEADPPSRASGRRAPVFRGLPGRERQTRVSHVVREASGPCATSVTAKTGLEAPGASEKAQRASGRRAGLPVAAGRKAKPMRVIVVREASRPSDRGAADDRARSAGCEREKPGASETASEETQCGATVRGGGRVVAGILGPLEAGAHLVLGLLDTGPAGALDRLARLQVLVDGEEVLDLGDQVVADVGEVAQVVTAVVRGRHADDLVVAAGFVGHPEHGDRAALDQAARERRLRDQHERVERVAVLTEGALDVAVVGRVLGRGEQRTIEADPSALVIYLVLVLLTLRDLDGDVEGEPAQRSDRLCVGSSHEGETSP